MNDRFKFRAIIKGYYYIDTPKENKEFEPLIFIENVDVLDIGEIGISEEDLEIAIRKQYSNLEDIYIERMLENFRDNSNGIDTYITVTPETVQQSTGLKDKNGKLLFEGDVVKQNNTIYSVNWCDGSFCFKDALNGKNYTVEFVMSAKLEVIGNIYENKELLNGTNP